MSENFLDGTGAKPISWWMFEEAATPSLDGNTTNHNDLTWPAGPSQNSDHKEGSFSLANNGHDISRVFSSLSSNFPLKGATTDFTIGGWVKIPASADSSILEFFDDTTHGITLAIGVSFVATGQFIWHFYSGGNVSINSNSSGFTTAQWVHIVMRWQGSTDDEASLWINGTKQTTTLSVASVLLVTGGNWTLTATVQTLLFDEWFVFDVALTDAQIGDIFNFGLAGSSDVTTPGLLLRMRQRRMS